MKELKPLYEFFKNRGWKPFPFQEQTWKAYLQGHSGLIHVSTGSGKTYAAILGPIAKILSRPKPKKGLKVLYLTPLRALARDLELALNEPLEQEKWPIRIESRTGDTSYTKKKKQLQNPSDVLLTTPESLSIMISQPNSDELLKNIEAVIVDEWHELLSSKRGSLLELSLSYLRSLNPDLQTWAMSASIGNLQQAAEVVVGKNTEPVIITSKEEKKLDVDCLLPDHISRFPWAGHMGLHMLPKMLETLSLDHSTLIFTNTRFQAEKWYETIRAEYPEIEPYLGIHHSSLSREEREAVENGIKTGDLKWVVCTSSLDLGVDFQPVETVVQIGSPKMVARLLQRAGRSAHRPGGKSRLIFVPTHAWEILELEAVKDSLKKNVIEKRSPIAKPMDVLLQYMLTLACGPGLKVDELVEQLKSTYSFSSVTQEELSWCLQFLKQGGKTLQNYPQFHKLIYDSENGRYWMAHRRMAMLHRMSIGTIVSYQSMQVVSANRKKMGTIEENFITSLKKGDVFQFAGKKLELLMIKDMTAYVKISNRPTNTIPSWAGGKFPISEVLASSLREILAHPPDPWGKVLRPILDAQKKISILPDQNTLLMETLNSKEGSHLFVFPFEGAMVHEGMAHLWASRFADRKASTFSFSANDYGFEILAPPHYDFATLFDDDFFSTDHMPREINRSLELSEMSKRQFRGIAQIAGLIFVGYPGAAKTGKQMHISASLLYDVFKKYETGHLLIEQSNQEVLTGSLETERLERTLHRLKNQKIKIQYLQRPSPLSFPLLIDRVVSSISNETLEAKVNRILKTWEKTDEQPTLS